MTQNSELFFNQAAAVSEEFLERIKTHVVPHASVTNLRLCATNLIVEVDSHGAFTPHGCPTCLAVEPGQDVDGIPTLFEKPCLSAEQFGLNASHLPPEALLNLWFCPDCRIPLMALTPKFQ